MKKRNILLIDAIINFVLALLLGIFPKDVISFLGLPMVSNPFYASILGGVFFGIGIALIIGRSAMKNDSDGLGLRGAIAINLSGGFVLALWLLFGSLNVPSHGIIIMWALVVILFVISTVELITHKK
ncbi:hypothetical protein N9164_13165 [Draconibacterium sp.]|nr:hypothetical protein [Draconibacterium sp.]